MKLIIYSLLIFISCEYREKSFFGDREPANPPIWYYFTINGLDSDGDNIRDDVEIWINSYTQEYHLNKSLKQFATATLQKMNASTRPQAEHAMKESRRSIECFFFIAQTMHPSEFAKNPPVLNQIQELVNNNLWRKHQYNKIGNLIPSSWSSFYSDGPYERFASCKFQISNFDHLLDIYADKFPRNTRLKELIDHYKAQVGNK